MAKASKAEAADHVELEGFEGHYAELGGTTVGWESYTADWPRIEQWGTAVQGWVTSHEDVAVLGFHTADGDKEFVGSEAYFVGPGHTPSIYAGTSLVEFSPTDRLNQTMGVVTRNMEAAG